MKSRCSSYFFAFEVITLKFISLKTLRSLCIDFIIFLVPVALIWFSLPHVLGLIAPFIAGFLLYFAANPLNKFLQKRRVPRTLAAFLSLALICAAVFIIFRAVLSKLWMELTGLTENIDFIYNNAFSRISQKISSFSEKNTVKSIIRTTSTDMFSSFFEALQSRLMELVARFSTAALTMVKNIPSMLVSIFASLFTTFFLLKEDVRVFSFFRKFFGEKVCGFISRMKDSFVSVTFSYIKAQLIIESIIFCILLAGFFILKIEYAFLLAFITAIVDVVPVFGTGTILIPMSLLHFFSGTGNAGWGILILYGITLLARQLCEPKIIGNKLGIHPLATVFSLYIGMKTFGIFGLILGPVLAIFIKNLITAEKEQQTT